MRMAVLVVPDVKVQFDADSYTVDEGGTQAVTVRLTADPQRTLTVPITATGEGGVSAADYELPASVTFNAGETSKTVTFTATQDMTDDDGESVKLAFGTMPDIWVTAGRRTRRRSPSRTTTTPPSPSASACRPTPSPRATTRARRRTTENEVTVTVTLSANPERSVAIPITKTNQGGASSSSDYSGVPRQRLLRQRGDLQVASPSRQPTTPSTTTGRASSSPSGPCPQE